MTHDDEVLRHARKPALFPVEEKKKNPPLFSAEEKDAVISRILRATGLPLVGSKDDLWDGLCDADIARDLGLANEAGKASELKQLNKILKKVTDLQKELIDTHIWSRLGRHEQNIEQIKKDLDRHIEQIKGPWKIRGLGPDTAAVQALAETFQTAFGRKATVISDSGDVDEDGSSDVLRSLFAPFVQTVFSELGWGAISAKGVKSRLYQKLKLPTPK